MPFIFWKYIGMKTLHDWFGNCSAPRVGWQIDPFGHSRENARLFDWMGFDGLFFARNDYRDKDQRIINKTLDMIWNAGKESQFAIFRIFPPLIFYVKSCFRRNVNWYIFRIVYWSTNSPLRESCIFLFWHTLQWWTHHGWSRSWGLQCRRASSRFSEIYHWGHSEISRRST